MWSWLSPPPEGQELRLHYPPPGVLAPRAPLHLRSFGDQSCRSPTIPVFSMEWHWGPGDCTHLDDELPSFPFKQHIVSCATAYISLFPLSTRKL